MKLEKKTISDAIEWTFAPKSGGDEAVTKVKLEWDSTKESDV